MHSRVSIVFSIIPIYTQYTIVVLSCLKRPQASHNSCTSSGPNRPPELRNPTPGSGFVATWGSFVGPWRLGSRTSSKRTPLSFSSRGQRVQLGNRFICENTWPFIFQRNRIWRVFHNLPYCSKVQRASEVSAPVALLSCLQITTLQQEFVKYIGCMF